MMRTTLLTLALALASLAGCRKDDGDIKAAEKKVESAQENVQEQRKDIAEEQKDVNKQNAELGEAKRDLAQARAADQRHREHRVAG